MTKDSVNFKGFTSTLNSLRGVYKVRKFYIFRTRFAYIQTFMIENKILMSLNLFFHSNRERKILLS